MRALLRAAALVAAASAGHRCCAASVEAGTLTTVTVDASLYDTRLAAAGGCDPAGCSGDKTRDGDLTTPDSRWSCTPNLGTGDPTCSVTYSFATSQTIDSLHVAMYQGATRTRTIDIYVDGVLQNSWTSSGTTTDFESIELGVSGQAVELRGVLADSEWLSITEVEILVDDGVTGGDDDDAMEVEAGTLTTVVTTAVVYDTRLSSSNGCDPEGCTAALTRDGDVSDGSRWSCSPSLGGTCSISYDLGAVRDLSQLRLAMYQGASRVRTMDISIDGVLATTWTSSGTTVDFESIDLSGYSGQDITIMGVLDDSEWISIVETEIMVLSDGVAPPPSPTSTTPAPVFSPIGVPTPSPTVATPEQLFSSRDIGLEDTTVTVTATLFDPSLLDNNGCDPAGCTADLTRDGDLGDGSRWSCSPSLGDDENCAISYTFGVEYSIDSLRLAMYKGTERQRTIQVYVDGVFITTWTSSGTTSDFETIVLPSGTEGLVLSLRGVLDDSEWISIIETEIIVWPQNVVTPPPAPVVTPPPAPVQPTAPPTPSPVGVLTPVGLTPLAIGSGSYAERYTVKDGDLSTSWECTGDANEPDDDGYVYYECEILLGLVYFRHLKQVKIALTDGTARSVDMRLAGRSRSTVAEEFVTSSGTTAGLETYDFDYKASYVRIAAVFYGDGESISIAEVEILEEVVEGEVLIDNFNTPNGNNEVTTDGFEWMSDSDEAIDDTLFFNFAGYFTVTEIQLEFPVGDTYKFDLRVYNEMDDTGEPYVLITGLESADAAGWQSFDLTSFADQYVTSIGIVMKGTGSGAPGFKLLDGRILGTIVDNPTDTFIVGSTLIEYWRGNAYPDFVGTGTGDQAAINGAICAVKKASYDGVDCVGGDDAATGMVWLSYGSYYVDGNIIMKSGVLLRGRFSDDSPTTTDIILEDGAAGNTDIDAIIVMDGISDAYIDDLWISGTYDPETSNDSPAVPGLGSICISVVNSQNITIDENWIENCDGDAVVVRNSNNVSIDAGRYDEEYLPWVLGESRGTGLIVDSSDSVWVRRHNIYDNGVAGIHITGSNNFTFEATISSYEGDEGEGRVGSVDGQQPIEVIIENSSLIKFQDMRVLSSNDPVMTVSGSTGVSFTNCGFSSVESGTCVIQLTCIFQKNDPITYVRLSTVIQTDDPSTVTIDADEDELVLEGTCYLKV